MKIDRERVKRAFAAYVEAYDISNPKIKLKIVHTYKVSDLCAQIAESLGLSGEDIDLAWLVGMLHDVGRFEQLRLYNTFADAESVDHAALSCRLLFEEGKIADYIDDDSENAVIKNAVANHSLYVLPESLDSRSRMFADILRDADKIDIIRVQLDTPLEEIYDISTSELKNSLISEEIIENFKKKRATPRALKRTPVDYVVGHISLAFELVYPKSRELMLSQGYLDRLMNFESDNPETVKQLKFIREYMLEFLGL